MIAQIVSPRIMRVGGGAVKDIALLLETLKLARPLIVTDPWMVSSGTIDRLLAHLPAETPVFSDTIPDPTDTVVATGVAALRAGDHDCLIGFGGGSPMDTAKAMAILAAAPPGARMRDFKVPVAADHAAMPVICIPTTAGTGSEVTRFTVITDTETEEKMLIAGLGCLPLAALVDYELTFSLPRRITADTGIDSLTHALEAFVSRRANPHADALALAAMRRIGPNLRRVWRDPADADAREAMMLGATEAGLAFSNSSVALVHGMSRPVGAQFHVPHGMSNAMMLPAIVAYSLAAAVPRYAQAARAIGCATDADADATAGAKLLDELRALNKELEVPTPRAFGIDPNRWSVAVPVMAQQALASGSPGNNPRVPDAAEIEALYASVFD